MSVIQAGNTTTTSLIYTGDTTGNLVFTTGGANTVALTLSNTQAATFANNVTITGTSIHTGNASFSNITASGTLTTASQGIAFASLPTGSVLQVVQGTLTTATSTTSSSFVTSGLTATITPKFSTSKIFILLSAEVRSEADKWLQTVLYKNGSLLNNINVGTHFRISTVATTQLSYSFLDSPATTSATTYALFFNAQNGGTASINVDSGTATIILMEIAA
jgi:hypothetical protein